MPAWTAAFPADRVTPDRPARFTQGRDRVAVFRLESGELLAVDDRCPHEGYPLSQGVRKGCVLTCSWHNFKFDLRDGACVQGDEAVRTFPVRVVDGTVEVDLTPPDRAAAIPGLWASLEGAVSAGRLGQATRDAARLLDAGVAPAQLVAFTAAVNGRTAEWGATHVLPISRDALHWLPRHPGVAFVQPLAQVLDLAIRDGAWRPRRDLAPAVDPGADPAAAGAALRGAVEAEDHATAEGLMRGALARGWGRAELEPWFFQLCADHFLDFGHRLIYQVKVWELLEAAGPERAEDILSGHLYGFVLGTREDVLPAWAGYRERLAALDLAALYARAGADPGWDAGETLLQEVLLGKPSGAFAAVVAALEAGAPLLAVVDALSLAAAERMLRFDVAIDLDNDVQDGWLSVTHVQTFANAVRHAVQRWDHPDTVRLLLQAARFINHHKVLDLADPPVVEPHPEPEVEAALAAVDAGDCRAALAHTAGLDGAEVAALADGLMDRAISDRFSAPIVSAHAMKNTVVALEEHAATGDVRHLLAAVRLFASPLQQRWTARGAAEAIAFVTDGKVPRLLAP